MTFSERIENMPFTNNFGWGNDDRWVVERGHVCVVRTSEDLRRLNELQKGEYVFMKCRWGVREHRYRKVLSLNLYESSSCFPHEFLASQTLYRGFFKTVQNSLFDDALIGFRKEDTSYGIAATDVWKILQTSGIYEKLTEPLQADFRKTQAVACAVCVEENETRVERK